MANTKKEKTLNLSHQNIAYNLGTSEEVISRLMKKLSIKEKVKQKLHTVMNDIKNRDDIGVLVNTFYAKIRDNELLGPIFNAHIPQEEWPKHLSKLTDFWETNLFGVASFKGNPSKKHINVDKNLGHTVSQIHFSQWIQLWFETIDELYKGQRATKAKESARKMATGQFLVIWNNRPDQTKLSK